MTVLILTPLALEYDAVSSMLLGAKETVIKEGAVYDVRSFAGEHHTYKVVLREPGMRNTEMALATDQAIRQFKPQIALLVGIAGGVKDVRIGDVLIANKAYGYESGKEDIDGFKARPVVESFSRDLLAQAQLLRRSSDWKKRTSDAATDAKIFIAPIAAGEKVVADINNASFQHIKAHLNDTLGLEMEAIGFATALQGHRHVHGIAIRGISDLCAGKAETDKQDWQPLAAERAAAVALELLYEMDCSTFIIPNMDAKTLAKEIYSLLFPLPESFKEIGRDFAGAANEEVREVWRRVKPLFITEVEKLAMEPEDTDRQAAVRIKLMDELEGKDSLQQELIALLKKAKVQSPTGSISIQRSKNVMIGSAINTGGGDFRLGDG